MKNCKYFEEQLMLKFYSEKYDLIVDEHLKTCDSCKTFYESLKSIFNIDIETIDYNKKFNKITKRKEVLIYTNFKYFIAACLIFFVVLFSLENIKTSKKILKNIGGDKVDNNFFNFSNVEKQLSVLENELNSKNFMEDFKNEKI